MRDDPETRLRHAWDDEIDRSAADVYRLPPRLQRELKPGHRRFDFVEAALATILFLFGGLALLFVACVIWALAIASAPKAKADEFRIGERRALELCRGWIDVTCSCSHRACWEAQPGEFRDLQDGRWQETASGQIRAQTGWSKDGVLIACAWRAGEPATGVEYYVGRGQPLRCLYAPHKGF